MKNKINKDFLIVLGLFLVVLASRIFLLNDSIDFFDSAQYVWRSELPHFFDAISTGHAPHHPGYILFTWLVNHLLNYFSVHDTYLAAAVPSAIFGSLAVLFFYLLVKEIFGKRIALLAALLVAITPYFWISNIAVIVDPTMICFYILSLYLFYLWLDKKNYLFLILSGLALGYSIWTHTQIAFWLLGFVALFIYKIKPKGWLKTFLLSLPILIGVILFIFFYLFVLVKTGHNPTYLAALKYLFGGNAGDHMPFSLKPGITNYIIIMTALGTLFSILGFIKLFLDKEYQKFLFLLIWLIPGLFISALYLYANLYGRSSMIAIFPGMIAVSYFLISWQAKKPYLKILQVILILLIIGQLLAISIPIIKKYASEPGVFQELGDIQKSLPKDGLYITSNLAKTSPGYDHYDVIWETPQATLKQDIENTLDQNKPVYISQDAIMFGFYRYDGDNWEIYSTALGGPEEHDTLAAELFSKYNFNLVATSNLNNKTAIFELTKKTQATEDRLKSGLDNLSSNQSLVLGQLFDSNSSFPVSRDLINIYSNEDKYVISPERINYRDLIYYLKNLIEYRIKKTDDLRDPLLFTYSDQSGFFTAALPEAQSQNLDLVASSFNLSTNDVFPGETIQLQFSHQKDQKLIVTQEKEGVAEDINEIIRLMPTDNSFYLTLDKKGKQIKYHIYHFIYQLDLSDRISAVNLPSMVGKTIEDSLSETKNIRYVAKGESDLAVFGPWVSLEKGNYQIKFRTKVLSPEQDILGSVSVTCNETQPIAQKDIEAKDLTPGVYQDIILDFQIPEKLDGVEFKMQSNGSAEIYLDYISLEKIE